MSLPEQTIAPQSSASTLSADNQRNTANGVLAALSTYLLWGFLPLFFRLLDSAGAVLIVAERTIFSLLFLAVILAFVGGFGEVRTLLSDTRRLKVLGLSSLLLFGNWMLYVWAVETGQVLEASFGYFINPLVNVALGMVLLGERQSPLQIAAIVIAGIAIAIQTIAMGSVPFVALGLALSFGIYGFIRKTAAAGPATGLFAETLAVSPIALAIIGHSLLTQGMGVHADPLMMFLLVMTGPVTAIPLLLFAYAVKRLRLTTIGMFQYLSPSIQFLVAIFVFGETLDPVVLVSFVLIWISLVVFTYDTYRRRGRARA
jgi:chloramphenicol-sensitive protein RarD